MSKQIKNSDIFNEMEIIFRNGEDIKSFVFAAVGVWAASMNLDYYTTKYFESESCSSDDWDPELISRKRNDFIKSELSDLSEFIQSIKSNLKLYHINTNARNINAAIETIWAGDTKYIDNLNGWKNTKSDDRKVSSITLHFETVKLDEMLFYLSFIYLDLLKVREFLLSKFDKSLGTSDNSKIQKAPNKIKESEKDSQDQIDNFGISPEACEKLYILFEKNQVINDVDFPEKRIKRDDFIKALSSPWPTINNKIYIQIETEEFTILMRMLSENEKYKNLTEKNIGNSGIFLSKSKGCKPFRYANLRKSFANANKRNSIGATKKFTQMRMIADGLFLIK